MFSKLEVNFSLHNPYPSSNIALMISGKAKELAYRLNRAWNNTCFLPAKSPVRPLTFDPDFGRSGEGFSGANCYAYSLGLSSGFQRWASPGDLKKLYRRIYPLEELTPRGIQGRLEHDGLIRIAEHSVDPKLRQVLAVVVSEYDYHFMRLHCDRTGWSSKLGANQVSLYDNAGQPIENAERAHWGGAEFAGYYKVPDEGIKYRF